MMARAATDWLFEACHPAPASAFSTWTAKIPKTRTHQDPCDEHPAEMGGGPRAESGERAGTARADGVVVSRTLSGIPAGGSATAVPARTGGESRPVPRVAAMDASFDQTGGRTRKGSGCTDTQGGIETLT